MIAAKLDEIRLARGPSSRALGWAMGTRPGVELIELSLARVRYRTAGGGPTTIVFVADPPNVVEHYDRLVELLTPVRRRCRSGYSPGISDTRTSDRIDSPMDRSLMPGPGRSAAPPPPATPPTAGHGARLLTVRSARR